MACGHDPTVFLHNELSHALLWCCFVQDAPQGRVIAWHYAMIGS